MVCERGTITDGCGLLIEPSGGIVMKVRVDADIAAKLGVEVAPVALDQLTVLGIRRPRVAGRQSVVRHLLDESLSARSLPYLGQALVDVIDESKVEWSVGRALESVQSMAVNVVGVVGGHTGLGMRLLHEKSAVVKRKRPVLGSFGGGHRDRGQVIKRVVAVLGNCADAAV